MSVAVTLSLNIYVVIYLPNNVKEINGIKVAILTSLSIPTFVTSIDEKCFTNCNFISD